MPIFLLRHAESEANTDWSFMKRAADFNVSLTPKGETQAREVGHFLVDYFKNNPVQGKIKLWCSPYLRTTRTALGLLETAGGLDWEISANGDKIFFDERVREREHGYLEGMNEEERTRDFPHQHAYFKKLAGKGPHSGYFARPYGGESPADVSDRLRSFYGSLMRGMAEGIDNHLIVTHGTAIRCFTISFLKNHPAFYDDEPYIGNTGIRLFDRDAATGKFADYGPIYDPEAPLYSIVKPDRPILRDLKTVF